MTKENGSKISKPFGLFVVIAVGIILIAYVGLGLVAMEVEGQKIKKANPHVAKVQTVVKEIVQPKKGKTIDTVSGKVSSISDDIVIVEVDLGGKTLSKAQLLLKKEDLALVQEGDELVATLVSEVFVSEVEDGALEVSNIVVKD